MKKIILTSLIFFILGFLISNFLSKKKIFQNEIKEIHQNKEEYNFINPLLECEGNEYFLNKKIKTVQENVLKEIEKKKKEFKVKKVSIYFRDLKNGPWFGVDEKEVFNPASLLKVPVLFAYLKEAENDPEILERKIIIKAEDISKTENVFSSMKVELGKEYSIINLLEKMIAYSDNNSFNALVANIEFNKIKQVNSDLSITTPVETTPEDYISIKEYAGLFRVLYNSSYLNKELSELALEMLSRAKYKEGLVAGVPSEVIVSHKFGIRKDSYDREGQLHDCGIVYQKENPYLLCVMTKGNDIEKLSETIKDISRVVYEGFK